MNTIDNENIKFALFVEENIKKIGEDRDFQDITQTWVKSSIKHNYAQNFTWLDRPIIQVPQDIYAIQEIIWKVKPDLIIETGIARGGSLIMSASMLALLDYCDAVSQEQVLNPLKSKRRVLGIDIDIREHNRVALEQHPLFHMIQMYEGSSIDPMIVNKVKKTASSFNKILIFLDSNHTHDHVLQELKAYAPLTSKGSYCVVWDTGVEDLPEGFCSDRPWGKGNNPKTAVHEYLKELAHTQRENEHKENLNFEIDKSIEHKISITASPDGFLYRP